MSVARDLLVEVRDLRVEFPAGAGKAVAVQGVDLDVPRGLMMGLVAESGCGKSVTARALLGLLPPSVTLSGSIRIGDVDVARLDEAGLA